MIINGNMIKKLDDFTWRVESADGSWSGYELYSTEEEAIEAAKLPSTEKNRDDRYNF